MELALTIGIGITCFLLIYFAFALGKEHKPLKLLALSFAIFLMLLMPKAAIDYNDHCDFVVTNQTASGNETYFTHDQVCATNTHTTATTFMQGLLWFVRIFAMYVFGYLIWEIFRYFDLYAKIVEKVRFIKIK